MFITVSLSIITFLVILNWLLNIVVRKANEYEMSFIFSKEYVIQAVGYFTAILGWWSVESSHTDELITFWVLTGLAFIVSLILNIRKSTVLYGIVFTLLQSMCAFALLLIGIFGFLKFLNNSN